MKFWSFTSITENANETRANVSICSIGKIYSFIT